MENFTPGPWFYKKDLVTIFSEEGDICDLVTSCNGKQMPVEANGYLIAAAPEMYEALKKLKVCIEDYFGKTEREFLKCCDKDVDVFFIQPYMAACNALKKARGE